MPVFKKTGLPRLRCHHRQTSCPRNRSRYRTTIITERRNQQNSIHPYLPSTKPCSQNVILKNFKILRNDPETKHIFSLPPLILFKRDKNIGNLLVRALSSQKTNQELSNVDAHDVKLVPLFLTWLRQDLIHLLKSLTTLHASPQTSSTA